MICVQEENYRKKKKIRKNKENFIIILPMCNVLRLKNLWLKGLALVSYVTLFSRSSLSNGNHILKFSLRSFAVYSQDGCKLKDQVQSACND